MIPLQTLRQAMDDYDRCLRLAYRNKKRGNLKRAERFAAEAYAIAKAIDDMRGVK